MRLGELFSFADNKAIDQLCQVIERTVVSCYTSPTHAMSGDLLQDFLNPRICSLISSLVLNSYNDKINS